MSARLQALLSNVHESCCINFYFTINLIKFTTLHSSLFVYYVHSPLAASTRNTTRSTSFSTAPPSPPPPNAATTLFSTYLPTMSASTFTLAPIGFLLSVILSCVCWISITLNCRFASSTPVSVSDAPSSAT